MKHSIEILKGEVIKGHCIPSVVETKEFKSEAGMYGWLKDHGYKYVFTEPNGKRAYLMTKDSIDYLAYVKNGDTHA